MSFAIPDHDPPDYLMTYESRQIALEVTQATDRQYVPAIGNGNSFKASSAISTAEPVLRLVDKLNVSLGPSLPNDLRIFLSLESPFVNFPRFGRWLEKQIVEFARTWSELQGAKVELHWPPNTTTSRRYIRPNVEISGRPLRTTEKKIGAGIANRCSRPEIPVEAKAVHLLAEILLEKEQKTQNILHDKWLCIVNRSYLLDQRIFHEAITKVSTQHRFSRILFVDQSGAVTDFHNRV